MSMKHWTDRQEHLERLGLTTPEGWPRPNAPQYLKATVYRTGPFWDTMPPEYFLAYSSFGVCYRVRCNRPIRISEAVYASLREGEKVLKACIQQAEVARLRKLRKS